MWSISRLHRVGVVRPSAEPRLPAALRRCRAAPTLLLACARCSSSLTSAPASTPGAPTPHISIPPIKPPPRSVLGSAQLARKAAGVQTVNVAPFVPLPAPAARTAPFPEQRDSNDARRWRPSEQSSPRVASDARLLTTPIFYANGSAHIGHLSTTLLLDALNRWNNIASSDSAHMQASWLTSGTDEHGSKVAESAAKAGVDPMTHTTRISRSFHELFQKADIHLDDYIRTTENRHAAIAQAVWQRLHALGYIYLGHHSGYYSRVDEAFVPDNQVEERVDPTNGAKTFVDKITGSKVEYTSEKNYKFRLSAFRQPLLTWIEQIDQATPPAAQANPLANDQATASNSSLPLDPSAGALNSSPIEPASRRREVLQFLRGERLEDISVSRLKSKVSWGVPLPTSTVLGQGDGGQTALAEDAAEYSQHVMYVWLDALSNYLTVAGVTPQHIADTGTMPPPAHLAATFPAQPLPSVDTPLWPPAVELIGKDILRFHAVYWPAFLIALNLPAWAEVDKDAEGQVRLSLARINSLPLGLPRKIVAHAHWLSSRTKMSKSLGNVVDPRALIDDFGVDAVRFFLLRDAQLSDDSNFAAADVVKRLHADLADTLGNLLARCIGPALLPENTLPQLAPSLMATHGWSPVESALIVELNSLPSGLRPLFSSLRFGEGLQLVFTLLFRVNAYLNDRAPWTMKKEMKRITALGTDASSADRLQHDLLAHEVAKSLYLCLETLRCVAILLQPIMPDSMARLLWRLAVPDEERRVTHAVFGRPSVAFSSERALLPAAGIPSPTDAPLLPAGGSSPGGLVSTSFVLFKKLESARVVELVKKYGGDVGQSLQELNMTAAPAPTTAATSKQATAKKKKNEQKDSKKPQSKQPIAAAGGETVAPVAP